MTKEDFIAQCSYQAEKDCSTTGGIFVITTPHETRKLMYSGLALESRTKAEIAGDIQDLIEQSWEDYND